MRQEKQLLLDEIKNYIDTSNSFVITKYNDMNVKSFSELRKELSKKNSFFEVVKKRVLKKALEKSDIQSDEEFKGHIGVVFAREDVIDSMKTVIDFAGENKTEEKKLEFVAGHIDGKSYNKTEVETLARLPGKDQLRAQLVGLFTAPLVQTFGTMNAIVGSVVNLLENKIKKENKQ